MNTTYELQLIQQQIRALDVKLGQVIRVMEIQNEEPVQEGSRLRDNTSESFETICPLHSGTAMFKGKKPTGVLFGESDRVDVGTWKKVFREILRRCNADPEKHVSLMNLRGRISGRERILLSKDPDGMRSPLKVADNLYVETHYDTETLLRLLMVRILDAVGYDYRHISVAIRNN